MEIKATIGTLSPLQAKISDTKITASFGGFGGGGAVKSVNGYTGNVVLGADDIKFSDGKTFQQKFNDGDMQGAKGDDGVSPQASVAQDVDGATVTVIDARGTTTAKLDNGPAGFSPTITEKTSTPKEYTLEITTETGSYITPNLKGSDGKGAVDSVNGYSGNVMLKAKDIETEAGETIEVALESAGKVKSVNTLTGEVILKAENINTNSGDTIETVLTGVSDRITALENLPNANEVKY